MPGEQELDAQDAEDAVAKAAWGGRLIIGMIHLAGMVPKWPDYRKDRLDKSR